MVLVTVPIIMTNKGVVVQNVRNMGSQYICVQMQLNASDDMKSVIPILSVPMLQKWTSCFVPVKLDKTLSSL